MCQCDTTLSLSTVRTCARVTTTLGEEAILYNRRLMHNEAAGIATADATMTRVADKGLIRKRNNWHNINAHIYHTKWVPD